MIYFFYLLVFFFFLAGLGVVLSKNPIHSIFYLILIFFFASILFFFCGLEFFAIMFVIIYVGAIAVLFLFIIMMLNVKIVELRVSYYVYLPITVLFIFFILLEFKYFLYSSAGDFIFLSNIDYIDWFVFINDKNVVERIGFVFYNEFVFYFFFCSLLLFLATFASISLTKLPVRFEEAADDVFYYKIVKFCKKN